MTDDPMFPRDLRAATLTQPWAGLVASGIKPIENRDRPIAGKELIGRRVAIHASREIDEDVYARIMDLDDGIGSCTFIDPADGMLVQAIATDSRWYKLSRLTSSIIGVATLKHELRGWRRGTIENGAQPPAEMIELAVRAAMESRCAKSKRGVVIYDPERPVLEKDRSIFKLVTGSDTPPVRVWSAATNGPPHPFQCARDVPAPDASPTASCGEKCRKLAVHAEERAILQALRDWPRRESHLRIRNPRVRTDLSLYGLHLLHVKVVDGIAVPSGPPSCIQCSRLIVETGPEVWLWEGTPWGTRDCSHCGYVARWRSDKPDEEPEDCPRCGTDLYPVAKVVYELPATWRLYTSIAFHGTTINNLNLRTTDP